MGAGGSAMAVVAADVVFLSNNLLRLPSVVSLCRNARATIIVNCVFAITVKLIAIVLATLGMLKLWHAVLIDVGSLLFVVINGSCILFKSHLFDDPKHSQQQSQVNEMTTEATDNQHYQPVVNPITSMV